MRINQRSVCMSSSSLVGDLAGLLSLWWLLPFGWYWRKLRLESGEFSDPAMWRSDPRQNRERATVAWWQSQSTGPCY
jgi:hypothetical protein